jgi:DNA-binding XRE family transcriptional regulator
MSLERLPRAFNARARWYVLSAKDLRLDAGMSMEEMAKEADVTRDRIAMIEAGHPVTELTAAKVFNALCRASRKELNKKRYVTESPPTQTDGSNE